MATAGCGVHGDRIQGPVAMQLLERSEPRSSGLADTAAAEADTGRISVRGTITVPDPCHADLRVSGSAAGRRLTVRVEARDTGGMCVAVLSALDYGALTAETLPSGRWVVEVRHAAAGREELADTDTVRVAPGG